MGKRLDRENPQICKILIQSYNRTMSQKQEGNRGGETKVVRSPADVQKRIEELDALIELNKFQVQEVPTRTWEILVAKRDELRWFLGEQIGPTDGVE